MNNIEWGKGRNARGWGAQTNSIGFGSVKSYSGQTNLTPPEPENKPNAIQKIVAFLFGKRNS